MKSKIIVLLTLLLTVSCASKSFIAETDKDVHGIDKKLLVNFETYWKLRANRDFDKSFDMENPYFKFRYRKETYRNYVGLFYKEKALGGVRINSFSCEKEYLCCFEMDDLYTDGTKAASRKDCWVQVKNNWYHIVDNQAFFK